MSEDDLTVDEIRLAAAVRQESLEALEDATNALQLRVQQAHRDGVPKVDIARAAGVSRPTVDKWLEEK